MSSSPRIRLPLAGSVIAGLAATTLLAVPATGSAPATARAQGPRKVIVPTLVARATLSADFLADGPPSGAQATPANGRTGPFAAR